MARILIYGAYGYTGRLASEYAHQIRLDLILAGRNTPKLQDMASSLTLLYRTFRLSDSNDVIDSALSGVGVVLNCAGPYKRTALPLIKACIRNGVHYLDIAAELDSYLHAQDLDQKAKLAGVMLMPGCGGSVVMLGCLAQHVVERMESPISIAIALHVSGPISRGSVISAQNGAIMSEGHTSAGLQRTVHNAESNKRFDFDNGSGCVECFPATLPDLITIRKAIRVPIVQTYVHVSGDGFPMGNVAELPLGPEPEEREKNPYHAAVEIRGSSGCVKRAALHTVNGYSFTSIASVEAAKRALAGSFLPGFQTPVEVFSSNFIDCVEGSLINQFEL